MARESAVLRRAREFRAQLVAAEAASSSEMAAVYRALATRLQPRLDVVIAQLVADSASGKLASPLAAARRADVNRVLDLAESELQKYVGFSVEHVAARQSALVVKAGSHAADLARLAAGRPTLTWAQPHPEHLEKLILLLRPGTPAHAVLEKLAPNGVDRVKAALVSGLAFGQTPEKIGQSVQDVLGGNLGRFLTVARTEDMRAYRIATHENFRANQDVVGQWRWMAALTYSTCAACLSLHGELFPLTQEMDSHPNCRCVPVPVVGGAPAEKWQSGEQWLRSQPEEIQRKTLGPAKFEAWKKGEISLADLRGHSHNEVWGNSFHETSLKNALEKAKEKASNTSPSMHSDTRIKSRSQSQSKERDPITTRYFGGHVEVVISDRPRVEAFSITHFSRALSDIEWSRLIGAPNDAHVSVESYGYDGTAIWIEAEHPNLIKRLERVLSIDADGDLNFHNEYFIAHDNAFDGFGARVFAQQVEASAKNGVKYIECEAAGEYGNTVFNGYYTWPRFGYNAPLNPREIAALPPSLQGANDLHELFAMQDGITWWKLHGSGRRMRFDLTEGSESRRVLAEYLKTKEIVL